MNNKIFSERLKLLREERNISQEELAELIGVSNAAISKWENGLMDISGNNILVLCDFFGVSADYLLGRED